MNTIEEIIEEIRQGKMVVLMDDEDRENEGDLIMAASCVRAEDINFMVRYARGLVCLPLMPERCQQLQLPLMVTENYAAHSTNFTLSIEAAKGVTTGISAADRARTIQAAVAVDAKASDIVQPGHIFPLMAQAGGVLSRAGHTEAGCDLAGLAGLDPSAVIVEILNEDGTMARRPELEVFAAKHDLKIGTVADLIHYRLQNEKTVERVAESTVETEQGEFRLFAYQNTVGDRGLNFALVKGQPDADGSTLVRVHMVDSLGDLLGMHRDDSGTSLSAAMARVSEEETAVVVLLKQPENPDDLIQRIRDYNSESVSKPTSGGDLRTFGVGAQILADIGVKKMRVLGTPKKLHGLSGFGLEITEYVQ